jgi:23S rRNA (cytosine1962-C5)-methyltransferase
VRLAVSRAAALAVRRGSPWIYREAVSRPRERGAKEERGEPGDGVEVVDDQGAFLAHGFWDPDSAIAVRVTSREPRERFGVHALATCIARAIARRDELFDLADTNAHRLCNGEGDGAPGVVVDRYAHVAVVRLDTPALARVVEAAADAIARELAARGVTSLALHRGRDEAKGGGSKITELRGSKPPDRVEVVERGVRMEVDLARGQKTGAFLDQREDRALVRALARGRRRALNLFSYAGGFSIAAALGGAARVTSVDLAAAAHATAQRTFRLNEVDPGAHAFVAADAFTFLEKARAEGQRFDLVVSDPPSFAPNEKSRPRALAAYRKLHGACAAVLAEGGVFCASSCSSHVDAEAFLATLDAEATGRGDLRVLDVRGNPPDHPTLPGWPEGRYLKFAVLG